MITLQGA